MQLAGLANWYRIYTDRKVLTVLLLGFSSGLPLLLLGATLGAWLQDSGLDKATIGLFALVAIPYSFNFLWAPIIDQLRLPWLTKRFGRRRGWMLLLQCAIAAVLVSFAFTDPVENAVLPAYLAVLLAFFSASQDVVIDAFRTEYLDESQYGEGAAVAVFGYRLGMLVAGAGALALADQIDWQIVYVVMAGCMAVGAITTLCATEPKRHEVLVTLEGETTAEKVRHWLHRALVMPFVDFMQRHYRWWLILLFILCYRIPDGFIGFVTTPFFLDVGFTKSQVAGVAKLYGFGATLIGMFAGGALISRYGIGRCLLGFLLLQIVTNVTYALLALKGPYIYYLMFAISMDNLSGGMVTAVAIAYMMRLCNLQYTATQYALLSSLASLASKTIASSAGIVAEQYGWVEMFFLSALLGLPAIACWYGLRHSLLKLAPSSRSQAEAATSE